MEFSNENFTQLRRLEELSSNIPFQFSEQAKKGEMDVDDMDSLFEGMVLFTPSQLVEDHGLEQNKDLNHPEPEPEPESLNSKQQQQGVHEPLDENLFSDLVLQTPLDQSELKSEPKPEPGPASSPAITRQMSSTHRKKKKATGFRIGYGRDYRINNNDADDHGTGSMNEQGSDDRINNNDADDRGTGSRNEPGSDDRINDNVDGHDVNHHVQSTMVSLVSRSAQSHQGQAQQQQEQQQSVDVDVDDAESRFEQVKTRISDKLNHARELAASVSAARNDSIRKRRKAADDLHLATSRLGELEKQLEEACEAEDFEAADRINESLAVADKDKQALLTALRDAEVQCNAIESKMLEVLNCQIAVEEECATLLHHFSEDAMRNADSVFKKSEAQSSEETENWLSSIEALELNKIELEIQAHLVNDARAVFNSSLDNLILDENREKKFLSERKDILNDELQKLLALVRDKEKEIAENESKMKQVDQRIADTVSGFQEMQSSIESKYDILQSHLSQMEIETETLSKKKEEIDKLLAEEENRGIKLKELAEISIGEAKMYQEVVGLRKSLLSSVLKSMEDKARLAKTEEKLSEDVQILQLEASTSRTSLQELSSTKSSIQQNIASLKQRVFFIDKMVPELEAEKKVAAASRNFKEAARLAAEAKSLSTEKESVQIETENTVLDLGKLEEEIKHTVDKLQETEGLISSKEKELAMARFQRLLLIAGTAKAERSATLELGDEEEANLLLAEANAANSEANELQPKYNLKEEEFEDLPKHFISLELVTSLDRTKLAELAALSGA